MPRRTTRTSCGSTTRCPSPCTTSQQESGHGSPPRKGESHECGRRRTNPAARAGRHGRLRLREINRRWGRRPDSVVRRPHRTELLMTRTVTDDLNTINHAIGDSGSHRQPGLLRAIAGTGLQHGPTRRPPIRRPSRISRLADRQFTTDNPDRIHHGFRQPRNRDMRSRQGRRHRDLATPQHPYIHPTDQPSGMATGVLGHRATHTAEHTTVPVLTNPDRPQPLRRFEQTESDECSVIHGRPPQHTADDLGGSVLTRHRNSISPPHDKSAHGRGGL